MLAIHELPLSNDLTLSTVAKDPEKKMGAGEDGTVFGDAVTVTVPVVVVVVVVVGVVVPVVVVVVVYVVVVEVVV